MTYTSVPCNICRGGKSYKEFPGARPACRGTPETPADNIGCSLRARTEVVIQYTAKGVRLGQEPSLCARKEDFGSGENRSVCAERRLFPGR